MQQATIGDNAIKPVWEQIKDARIAAIDSEIAALEQDRKDHHDAAKACTEQIVAKRHERDAVAAYQYVGKPRAARRENTEQPPLLGDEPEPEPNEPPAG